MLPTTKAKQRRFVIDLMVDIYEGRSNTTDTIMRLHTLLHQLRNRKAEKRADQVAAPMTPQLQLAIWAMHMKYPDMAHQTIAETLNINHGRVSETLAGKRR